MKRMGIYYFYDKNGIVDDYVINIIKFAKDIIDDLIIVVGGYLNNEGNEKLTKYTTNIFVINNCYSNLNAYQYGILKYEWKKLEEYDEIVLFDSTLFGPFYSLTSVFDEMIQHDVDYWGIVKGYMQINEKFVHNLEYIDSSFIVLRKSILINKRFQLFCKNSEFNNHNNNIFIKFKEFNFISNTYIDTNDLLYYSNNPFIYNSRELIEKRNCPFLSKKALLNGPDKYLEISGGEFGMELYTYLNENKNYDSNMIWNNVLRTANMYDIKQCMQWNYILSTKTQISVTSKKNRVALFLHIYYADLIDYCRKYAESMPKNADIIITTCDKNNKKLIEKSFESCKEHLVKIIIVENRGRDISALLIGLKPYIDQYDLVCFAHDKKAFQSKPYIIGESFSYSCFENILSSKEYVNNIIVTFEENPRLGLLTPPPPCHGPYYQTISQEWQNNYTHTIKLARKLGIDVDIVNEKPPIAPFGTMFWFRSSSLKLLFNSEFQYTDFPTEPTGVNDGNIMHAIERIYPFAVQQQGYFVGWLMSDIYSKMYITNLNNLLQDINKIVLDLDNKLTYKEMLGKIDDNRKKVFCELSLLKKIKILARKTIGNDNYYSLWNIKTKLIRMSKERKNK